MKKHIFIVNGMARAGKDTFAEILKELTPGVSKFSSIDTVKEIASHLEWDGGKTEEDRKFLSDLKVLLSQYSDIPFRSIIKEVSVFYDCDPLFRDRRKVLLIDIREPEEIERAKVAFNAKTVFIENNRVDKIVSNMADAGVYNYEYDYIVENNGTLEEFRENIKEFAKKAGLDIHGCVDCET